ncbi:hypothetical protein LTS08_007621 [Lithohypha guttulata]|uniref:uncharacterized protein n=1 Tax=Lithohypha guttulata TaxID=1690604 RepID=UPI002DDEF0AA|nr:hypothetical protein LTR51_008415 [Lithohypha guttulata]KAK5096365.1 hypothetical protein LTS08_007621 [Lithohypha guttulata]
MTMNSNPTEMEAFQTLSDKWHPGMDQQGPLIGMKVGMDVLVSEYAQADQTYVVKTTGLAATHTSYRAVKGDGQCGWRATVFCYFEILLNSMDPGLVQAEKIRFESYGDTMKMVGIDYDLMVDMFDYTWELFDAVTQAVQTNGQRDSVILNIMNDENKSNSIVYHFKMVTSAYMKLREEEYVPWTETLNVDEYRIRRIDPTNEEIDELGLKVLTDAVILPAGFGLEVLYLDRSMGDQVTPHSFTPDTNRVPTIRLLYRPGHYDIIYKETQPLQVYLQPRQEVPVNVAGAHNNVNFYSDFGSLFSPPTGATYEDMSFLSHGNYNQHQNPYAHYSQPLNHSYYNFYHPQPVLNQSSPMMYLPPPPEAPPTSLPSWSAQPSARTSIRTSTSPRSTTLSPSPGPSATAAQPANEPQFRFTTEHIRLAQHGLPSVPLLLSNTSSTANNPAFIGTPKGTFQPQQYSPGDDYGRRK